MRFKRAGVAILLGTHLRLTFPLPQPINVVAIGPPRVGNEAFYDFVRSELNIRVLVAPNDMIPRIPCYNMPECPQTFFVLP